jgi:hypothetical protein
MNQPDYDVLEQLEHKLGPLLRRRGFPVEHLQPIGLIGRGASSSVFSLLINGKYHVLKLYYSHASFLREQRNRRRLMWPPRLVLASRQNENSLGYDLVITEVPKGESFNSDHLLDWVQDRLGRHLIELHRMRRSRKVTLSGLRQALADTEEGVMRAGDMYGPDGRARLTALMDEVRAWLARADGQMRVQTSVLHNDLWWDNIIVAHDDVYLIDWESMKLGDYAEDLAFGRVMVDYRPDQYQSRGFWRTARNPAVMDRFWCGIVDMYAHEFQDNTLPDRLRFYLMLQTFRRLSDLAYSTLPPNPELLNIWVDQLPGFWEHGLEPV